MRTFAPSPLRDTLLFTAGMMFAAGVGFGLALRSAPPTVVEETGETDLPLENQGMGIFRTEQTFPPRAGWNLDSEEEGNNAGTARYNSLQMQ